MSTGISTLSSGTIVAPVERPLLLVDDHEILTTGMASYLRGEGFIVETLNPTSADDVLNHPALADDAFVISDLQMPAVPDVFALFASLVARRVRILALTGVTDPVIAGRALRAGALAVIQKSEPLDVLADLIRTASEGRPVRAGEREEQLGDLREAEKRRRESMAVFDRLSQREGEILLRLIEGHSPAATASSDFVSIATVRAQIRSILAKLGVTSQLEAVALANRADFKGRRAA